MGACPVQSIPRHHLRSHLDEIYERALDRCKFAAVSVEHPTQKAITTLTDQINMQGEGISLVVFNLLGHERKDVARCTVGLGGESWEWLSLYDEDGNQIPLQLQDVHRHTDGSIKRADLIFIAQVPAFGYRTYFLRGGEDRKFDTDLWSD